MGDRIVVLNNGVIQQIDTPYNIYNHPKNTFVATFMGTNPMNIVEGSINNGFLTFGNITLSVSSLGIPMPNKQKLLVGVRPEHIAIKEDAAYHFNLIKFSAPITFEENLGSYKNIYFKLNEKEFCCCTSTQNTSADKEEFSINPKDLHFFDIETLEPIKI